MRSSPVPGCERRSHWAALPVDLVLRFATLREAELLMPNDRFGRDRQAHELSLIVDVRDCLEWHPVEAGPQEEEPAPQDHEVGPIGVVAIEQMLHSADVSTVTVIDVIPLGFGKPGR